MIKRKGLIIIGAILMSITLFVGCDSRSNGVNNVSSDTIEKLPEDQKESELDKLLATMRKERKDGYKETSDGTLAVVQRDPEIPGQSKNMPNFGDEGEDKWKQQAKLVTTYIEKELKIPKRPVYGYERSRCIDPRINAIYDDEDKGVAKGYDNENIYIEEYETEKDDVYSYIFLVRDSKESPWKVIHHGDNYKK